MKKVFIVGCGYVGTRIARLARQAGHVVTCMVRTPQHGEQLRAEGFETIVGALDDVAEIPALAVSESVVFYLVPPPGGGVTDPRARNFSQALASAPPPAKLVYFSATSVYGPQDDPVDELSLTEPTSAMGKRRLDAEGCFKAYGAASGVPLVILRVSGIYGPGRLPLMQISQGQPLLREEESGPSNRIHVDDLASIARVAAEKGQAGDIFNVSDGHPTSMTTYFNACADLLGKPRQPQVTMEEARRVMSPLMLAYVSESRTVDNRRMLDELGIVLRYPTLQEGLKASRG